MSQSKSPRFPVTVGYVLRRCCSLSLMLATFVPSLRAAGNEIIASPKISGITVPAPQREIIYEGLGSYGHYRVFGDAEHVKLYTAGIEYDRELWPRVFGARVDYVTEILPVVILSQSAKTDFLGDSLSQDQKIVPGVGITPLGFRLLWRDGRRIMPFFETKATVLGFTQKALTDNGAYENWSFQGSGGVKLRLGGRYDLRLGLLNDLHFSNANVVASNPGLDVMNVNVGIVYHLGPRGPR